MNVVDGLIVGYIVCAALAIALFFLRFWQLSRDSIFLAFACVFAIEGITRGFGLFETPSTDRFPWVNIVRLLGYLILIATIISKNARKKIP